MPKSSKKSKKALTEGKPSPALIDTVKPKQRKQRAPNYQWTPEQLDELQRLGTLFVQQAEQDRMNWVQTSVDNFLNQFESTIPNIGDARQVAHRFLWNKAQRTRAAEEKLTKTPHFVFKRARGLGASDLWAKNDANAAAIQTEIERRDPNLAKDDRLGLYATVKKQLFEALSEDSRRDWQSMAEDLARKTKEKLEEDPISLVFENQQQLPVLVQSQFKNAVGFGPGKVGNVSLFVCLSFEAEDGSVYHKIISASIMPKDKAFKDYNVEAYTNFIQAYTLYSEEAITALYNPQTATNTGTEGLDVVTLTHDEYGRPLLPVLDPESSVKQCARVLMKYLEELFNHLGGESLSWEEIVSNHGETTTNAVRSLPKTVNHSVFLLYETIYKAQDSDLPFQFVFPSTPASPIAPVSPSLVVPVSPTTPISLAPVVPVSPIAPISPSPVVPASPVVPTSPVVPFTPFETVNDVAVPQINNEPNYELVQPGVPKSKISGGESTTKTAKKRKAADEQKPRKKKRADKTSEKATKTSRKHDVASLATGRVKRAVNAPKPIAVMTTKESLAVPKPKPGYAYVTDTMPSQSFPSPPKIRRNQKAKTSEPKADPIPSSSLRSGAMSPLTEISSDTELSS